MSFTPIRRLNTDSTRSPAVEATTMTAANGIAQYQGEPITAKAIAPTTAEPTKEPARPSQLFFGEIFGAIGCLPQFTPAIKPNVSLQMAISRIMRMPRSPWSVWK